MVHGNRSTAMWIDYSLAANYEVFISMYIADGRPTDKMRQALEAMTPSAE